MEKLEKYRSLVRQLLKNYTTEDAKHSDSEIECQLIFDTEHDHYQLLDIGWDGLKRVYNCFIHIDIKDGKIWIQRNMTEADLAQDLVEMGIPKEDIILGLHPSYKRPYTGYGVASVRSPPSPSVRQTLSVIGRTDDSRGDYRLILTLNLYQGTSGIVPLPHLRDN